MTDPRSLWEMPVPSTALLEGGPIFEQRPGRALALRYSYEGEDDESRREMLLFKGVEAFRCTYYHARAVTMLAAYDRLLDLGPTPWLEEVGDNLRRYGDETQGLVHLMIGFDDGPTYELICRSFQVEQD